MLRSYRVPVVSFIIISRISRVIPPKLKRLIATYVQFAFETLIIFRISYALLIPDNIIQLCLHTPLLITDVELFIFFFKKINRII